MRKVSRDVRDTGSSPFETLCVRDGLFEFDYWTLNNIDEFIRLLLTAQLSLLIKVLCCFCTSGTAFHNIYIYKPKISLAVLLHLGCKSQT